jgi:hypothetical protein
MEWRLTKLLHGGKERHLESNELLASGQIPVPMSERNRGEHGIGLKNRNYGILPKDLRGSIKEKIILG